MRRWSAYVRAARGAAALEFAIVAPAFVVLVVGILQLGYTLHNGASVRWAVETAARTALLNGDATESTIQAAVDAQLAALGSTAAIDIAYAVDTTGSVDVGRITGVYSHRVSVPLVPEFDARFSVDVSVPRY